MGPLVVLEGISFSFADFFFLDDLSSDDGEEGEVGSLSMGGGGGMAKSAGRPDLDVILERESTSFELSDFLNLLLWRQGRFRVVRM